MRDIIFKGKRKDKGEWVEGYLFDDGIVDSKRMFIGSLVITEHKGLGEDVWDIGHAFYEVLPETVGQYTGLTDKKDKKIFEGDIVRADNYVFSIKYGKCGGTPNADNYGYMGFYLEAAGDGTKLHSRYGLRNDICYFTDIEIIGNIWDNSVML